MLQYLVQINSIQGEEQSFTLSKEDIRLIRTALVGRTLNLENYVCYLTSDGKLAMARRPTYVEEVIVGYSQLCRKLAEAEVEDAEGASE